MDNVMKILEFIFQSFWHWLGTVIILEAIFGVFRGIITINNKHEEKSDEV